MIELSVDPSSKDIQDFSENYITLLLGLCQEILNDFNHNEREVSMLICDDRFIHTLNKEYRAKDSATDVLSFAFDDDDEFILPNSSLGEIIISAETAMKQAKNFDISYEEEFARLAIHGLLHLLGYDHELGEKEHQEMFAIQDKYMDIFMERYDGTKSHLI